jgi:hypothetical protein
MFRLIAIDFSQKSPHFSLLSLTSPGELSEREVTSLSNLKVVQGHMEQSVILNVCVRMERHVIPKERASVLEDGL